jgi:hypothetical protein
MTDTAYPQFFDRFPMLRVVEQALDDVLVDGGQLRILFLWGRDCPNCDIAKAEMLLSPERFVWDDVQWLHDNVYEDPAMGTRFGLHGIPAFVVFRGTKKLGRISQWPGTGAFVDAIEKIRIEGRRAGVA